MEFSLFWMNTDFCGKWIFQFYNYSVFELPISGSQNSCLPWHQKKNKTKQNRNFTMCGFHHYWTGFINSEVRKSVWYEILDSCCGEYQGLWSSGIWCHVGWWISTNIFDEPAAFTFYPEDGGIRFL